MAHQEGLQGAWYNGRSGHELGQSVNVAYTPSIDLEPERATVEVWIVNQTLA